MTIVNTNNREPIGDVVVGTFQNQPDDFKPNIQDEPMTYLGFHKQRWDKMQSLPPREWGVNVWRIRLGHWESMDCHFIEQDCGSSKLYCYNINGHVQAEMSKCFLEKENDNDPIQKN